MGAVLLPHELCSFTPPLLCPWTLLIHEKGNIGASENCDNEPPVLVTMCLDVPGFGWGAAHKKCKNPECDRKCGCCDEGRTPEVRSAVAAERVEFGDPPGTLFFCWGSG